MPERELQRPSTGTSHVVLFSVFALAFVAIELLLIATTVPQALAGNHIDPDSFTRLLRVQDLVTSGNWFDTVEPRLNAPYGLDSHWTRPVDVLIVLLAAPLAPFMGWAKGLYWAGFFLSPTLALLGFLLFAWAVTPLVGRHMKPLAMAALLAQPGFLNYALPGRADHHMLFVLAFIGALGLGVRLLERPDSNGTAMWLGAVMGFGLLVSVEFLITVTLVAAVLAFLWVRHGDPWAQAGFRVLAVTAGVTALAVLSERGGSSLTIEYDRVSVVHMGVAVVGTLIFMGLASVDGSNGRRILGRTLTALAIGSVGLAFLVWAFPGLIADPLGQGDPVVWARYWTLLEELQPLRPSTVGWGGVLGYAGSAALALPFMLVQVRRSEHRPWLLPTVLLVVYLIFTARQIRYFPYTAVLLATGVVGLLAVLRRRFEANANDSRTSVPRALTTAALLGGPLLIGGLANGLTSQQANDAGTPQAQPAPERCSFRELVRFLDSGADPVSHPQLILALPDIGPELAYRTSHTFVAAPYHRMESGIRSALTLGDDEEAIRSATLERGVDLLLICPAWDASLFTDGGEGLFYSRLRDGDAPPWLERQELPPSMSGFRLYSVVP